MIALRRAALALLVLLAGLAPATGAERILSFISDVKVLTNSDLLVTETIRIQAEGDAFKHGLLRDFPTTYTRRNGTRVRVGFDVQSVTRDGVREAFTTERKGNGVEVRIGDPDVMLSFGPHEYAIRYLTTRQIGFFPDFDELYWNATGNGWAFTIDQAEARMTLPASAAFLSSAFYTGRQGADGKDATVIAQRPGYIAVRTTQPLPLFAGILALGSIGVAAEILDDVPGWLQAAPVGLPLILFPLAVSAFYWMKAHTVAGRKITDQIEGFRQYLGVAEEARLDALNPPDKTPELFERFLPYAVALDVENHRAQRFAGVLAAAAAAGATATWYSGSHDWGHDPVGFANNLGGDLSSTIASASEAPGSSSGSGGGGFSGGGGGGGGGGGW